MVTVAIRYYSHLPLEEMRQLELPVGNEIEFRSGDMSSDVNHDVFDQQIRQNLRRSRKNAPPFDGRHADSWKIDIWLMPQVPEGRTLLRFAAKDTFTSHLWPRGTRPSLQTCTSVPRVLARSQREVAGRSRRSRHASSEYLRTAFTWRSGGGNSVSDTSLTTWPPELAANDHMQVNQSKDRRARFLHRLFHS